MNKVAHYLQEHLVGEVMTNKDVLKYFSTDGGVFEVMPSMVVYPQNENDIRKTTRFAWQLAERGRPIPITARGRGSDQAGAAVGTGIILATPSHMKKLIQYEAKNGTVVVEPGIVYGKLQQALHTHKRFLPPFPSSIEFCTIGGAVANNAAGEKTVKYGCTRDYVKKLRVVLANGEVIETERLNKRALSKKLGLSSFEGEIYRALDKLIEENHDTINSSQLAVSKNSAGYAIAQVKAKDGSFDLTPLIVGSQGTLGIVSEVTLGTEPYNPNTTLIAAFVDEVSAANDIVQQLHKLSSIPSAIEVVDENLLNFLDETNPNQLKGIVEKPFSKLVLLIEFDDLNDRNQKKLVKKTQ